MNPFTDNALAAAAGRLEAGLEGLSLAVAPEARPRLLEFLRLLSRWNRAYNLTRVTDPLEMVDRHLIDSLAVLPWLSSDRLLDAGTGAGFPGVPLAIACPERHFVLVDSSGKKIRFLNHLHRSLGLENIEPLRARVEAAVIRPPPGEILCRALAPLPRLVDWTARWLDGGARLLAMKGTPDADELKAVPGAYNVRVETLNLPGQAVERCLVIVEKAPGAP